MKCCICGAVKTCEKYLPDVFKNIEQIKQLFDYIDIVLVYDNSSDKTLDILKQYQEKYNNLYYYVNKTEISKYRTVRLAHARNICINFVFSSKQNYDYFIMMDFDDVCSTPINIDVLNKYLHRNDWDCLSFNKNDYYDIWALSKYPYFISFFHFKNNPHDKIKQYINNLLSKLNDDELLKTCSAFNGFAIYKTHKFINCSYNGYFNINLFPKHLIKNNINAVGSEISYLLLEDCEHRNFHVESIIKNNANICISKDILFI